MVKWLKDQQPVEAPILDQAYLDRLANHIGESETRELIADGMLELAERLDRLRRLTERGTVDEIGLLAHDIAGASGHQGLSAMSIAAVEAARQAREVAEVSPVHLAEMILQHREASLAALSAYCSNPGAAAKHG